MMQSTIALVADVRTPPLAPLVALAFLGAGFAVACCAVGGAVALAARRFGLARILGGAGLTVAVVYGVLLLAAGLFSREKTLRAGERKYFCEMDCHLAYSVAAAAGPSAGSRIVTIRTWFDPDTIASFRGNGPLWPNPRIVYLQDASGRHTEASAAATRHWEQTHGRSTPLTQELRPGESYDTTLVFEVPRSASGLRLFLGDPPGLENLMIGHENGPLHGKVYFELPAISAASGQAHS